MIAVLLTVPRHPLVRHQHRAAVARRREHHHTYYLMTILVLHISDMPAQTQQVSHYISPDLIDVMVLVIFLWAVVGDTICACTITDHAVHTVYREKMMWH